MSGRGRRGWLACALVVGVLCAIPLHAQADVFGPISLVSDGSTPGAREAEQVDYAHDPALSGDGRYVVFDGSVAGVTGVWRRDLSSGRLEQVAGGDAELPSVSDNGQYVSFTTNEGASLGAITDYEGHEAKPEAVNVYVRDMSKAPTEAGAFTIVSAVDGSSEALSYQNGEPDKFGSVAAGRSAISADGREVSFVTTATSNLAGAETPPLQVAVRYLDSEQTKLVSTDRETGGPVPEADGFGAVLADSVGTIPPFSAPKPYDSGEGSPGASISADGGTVAWMGANIAAQAPMLPAESPSGGYTEPLWRRIAPGSETPTERVTGGSDPSAPGCAQSGETALPVKPSSTDPCQGPFVAVTGQPPSGIWASGGGEADFVPRLSADGYTVAFMSRAPLVALGTNFGNTLGSQASDLFVADMHPGRSRDQALTQLTELAGAESAGIPADTAAIFDFDISPNGAQVAFSTRRTQFPLGSPAFVSAPAPEAGMNELFDVDLGDDTLTRVTHGFAGGQSEHPHPPFSAGTDPYQTHKGDGALSPSFSSDGVQLAFASTASNLVFGDGNTPSEEEGGAQDGSDAFTVERVLFQSISTLTYLSAPPPGPRLVPPWTLGVTASSRGDGTVLLYVTVPGAGTLRANAESAIVQGAPRTRSKAGGKRRARGARRRARVLTRTVAAAKRATGPSGGQLVTLVLKLAKPYSKLATRKGGLSASVSVAFGAAGRPALHRSIRVDFHRTLHAKKRPRKTAVKRAHGRQR